MPPISWSDPRTVIVVGDSFNDVEGARRAGMRTIADVYGYSRVPATEFGADVVIDALIDLPRAVMDLPAAAVIALDRPPGES
jgi:phosphoglycolate phosphatase-like HAD superfamily hydrolase